MIFNGVTASTLGVTALAQSGVFIAATDDDTFSVPGVDGRRWLRSAQTPKEFPVDLRTRAADAATLRASLDAIAAWLASGPAQLVFDDELPDRAWVARLTGGLVWSLDGGSLRVSTSIKMVADDPHAYALTDDVATLTAPGDLEREQGNATSWPTVEITGVLSSIQSVTLTLWGSSVTITGPLAAGERMRLDYSEYLFTVINSGGTVLRNLAPKMSSLSRIACPVVGGAVSWSVTGGSVSQVKVEANSRWL